MKTGTRQLCLWSTDMAGMFTMWSPAKILSMTYWALPALSWRLRHSCSRHSLNSPRAGGSSRLPHTFLPQHLLRQQVHTKKKKYTELERQCSWCITELLDFISPYMFLNITLFSDYRNWGTFCFVIYTSVPWTLWRQTGVTQATHRSTMWSSSPGTMKKGQGKRRGTERGRTAIW